MVKLERLLSKHFKVEKTVKGVLKVYRYPKSGNFRFSRGFSRRDWDKVTEIADRYGANVNGIGYISITKKRGHQGQNSEINQGRKRAEAKCR